MLQCLRSHHGEYRCQTHSVVGAEGRAVGRYPFAVDIGFDRIFGEIERFVVVFLRHHIHVRLQDDALAVLHAGSGRFAHDHIARLVGEAFDPERVALGDQIVANGGFVARRTGNRAQGGKLFPHLMRCECCYVFIHDYLVLSVSVIVKTLPCDASPEFVGMRFSGASNPLNADVPKLRAVRT